MRNENERKKKKRPKPFKSWQIIFLATANICAQFKCDLFVLNAMHCYWCGMQGFRIVWTFTFCKRFKGECLSPRFEHCHMCAGSIEFVFDDFKFRLGRPLWSSVLTVVSLSFVRFLALYRCDNVLLLNCVWVSWSPSFIPYKENLTVT